MQKMAKIMNKNILRNENLNCNNPNSSFIFSPSVDDGKRKISLSASRRKLLENRKSLQTFTNDNRNENRTEQSDDDDDDDELSTSLILQTNEEEQFRVQLKSLNEINSKQFNRNNAFAYNVLNIIGSLILNSKQEQIDFKMIGMTIDACTKLLESKVDLVFTNMQKISSSLTMATSDQQVENVELNNDNDEDDDLLINNLNNKQNERQQQRRKKRKNLHTIISNLDQINGKPDINIDIDPLFYHLSSAFDVGNVDSLLMSNLSIDPMGKMLLDSNASLNFQDFNIDESNDNRMIKFTFLNKNYLFNENNYYCCKPCRMFEFLQRDNDCNDDLGMINETITATTTTTTTDVNLNFDFDINANVDDIYINDNDDDDNDTIENFYDDFNSSQSTKNLNNTEDDDDNILKFLPNLNDMNNQFFNRTFMLKTFHNLARYRNLCRHNQNKNNDNNDEQEKKIRKKSSTSAKPNDYRINLLTDSNNFNISQMTLYQQKTIQKWFTIGDGDNQTTNRFLSDMQRNYLKLNQNHHQYNNLYSCFFIDINFNCLLKKKTRRIGQEDDGNGKIEDNDGFGCNGFDLNDFNDSDDDELHRQRTDNYNNDLNFYQHYDNNKIMEQSTCQIVDPLDINYAKVAKKIDIKKVKLTMWSLIKQYSVTNIVDNELLPSSESSETNSQQEQKFSFKKLRKNLPNSLRQNLNENLTTSISFVALLHLCNEKNLKLTTTNEMSDFQIDAPSNTTSTSSIL